MLSGNQRTRPNRTASWTDDPLVSAVTNAELADYLGVDDTDPLLSTMGLSATQVISDFTGVELISRTWHYKLDHYPNRQAAYVGLDVMPALPAWWLDLPKWPVTDVIDVTADDFTPDERMGRVFISRPEAPLTVEYQAGYDNDLPAALKQAVLMLAGFMYERRGACDVGSALAQSGAEIVARPYRRIGVGL